MSTFLPEIGQDSIWSGLRRLHQTEVRLDAFQDVGASLIAAVKRSFRALCMRLTPRFLFTDDRRLELSLLSPTRLHNAVMENLKALREFRLELDDDQPLSILIGSFAATGPESAVIRVSPGCASRKTIAVPAGIKGRSLLQSLEYLLEAETPFRRDQVYWGFQSGPKRGTAGRLIDLVVVPKSTVDPVAAALRERRIHLREISYRDELSSDSPICLARYARPQERYAKRLLSALGLIVVAQVLAIAALPIIVQTSQTARFDDATARLSRVAGELGGLQSSLENAMAPIRDALQDQHALPSGANVLRLLEAELGEETVLDRLSLRGAMVQVTGSTSSVGALTERLEELSHFKPKSITRNGIAAASQQELFSVSLELTTAKEP